MKSHLTPKFHRAFDVLPGNIRDQVPASYKLFHEAPFHLVLDFKKVHADSPLYAMRVGVNYRALGVLKDDLIVWFWIGSNAEYDKMFAKF